MRGNTAPRAIACTARTLITHGVLALACAQGAMAQERQLQTPGPAGPLGGTLRMAQVPEAPVPTNVSAAVAATLAPQPAPAVLIIPGSGPTDRDGNSPAGIRASTYRLLAEALAQQNISSLRIDKRGLFGSSAAVADPNAVTIADYATDVRNWIAPLREATAAPCIWLLGHSEGGVVALAAGQGLPPDICGLILVATPGRPLGQVLREQFRTNPANAPLLDQALAAIDALEAGRRVDTGAMHPALASIFHPSVQGYLMNTFPLDPAVLIAGTRLPVLILQGERDIQVSVTDAQRLQQAQQRAKLVFLPSANHVLKQVTSDDRNANMSTYVVTDLPLAGGVVRAITEFIEANTPRR
ncbi:alpha/beta hydrolase [Variovorax sp. VNK109]|uniref:alpha/beta hydrolase n=1 Tax=Variovorax sp. VNK109 TaxID=3400919 RepID=UPI003BFFA1D4